MSPLCHRFLIPLLTLVAAPVLAQDLEVRTAEIPPHMDLNGAGREADILNTVADACGWTMTFVVEPFTRHWWSFEAGEGDAAAIVPIGTDLGGTPTDAYVSYRNGVTILDATGRTPTNLNDLAGLDVVAFAGATGVLPGLLEARAGFASYREVGDQFSHSRLLFGRRVQAILGDGMIIAEYNKRLANAPVAIVDTDQPVSFYPLFEPTPFAMVFRDPEMAMAFNDCLARSADRIDAINAGYVARYRDLIGDVVY